MLGLLSALNTQSPQWDYTHPTGEVEHHEDAAKCTAVHLLIC